MIESRSAAESWRLEKLGITFGPIRTASAIWVVVACLSGGATAPVT